MRLSKMHLKTLREAPSEAEIESHILLLRAGMIRRLVSGIYGFMPLGLRSLKKIENIIREEMNDKGGQEILMSAVQPAELWMESGRWYAYGPELWRLKDRHDRDFCLGPTHEEVFTDIVRNEVSSHRQLPINLYQIQTKYRDEARPRFGLMRSREFIMKDSYSFDKDKAGLDDSYVDMYDAYTKIFTRAGLEFRTVMADTGAIGGSDSHEFTALSQVGESEIAYCLDCEMAATVERAKVADEKGQDEPELLMKDIHTPGTKTIEDVAAYLGLPKEKTIKALLFVKYNERGEEDGYVAAFIRGDRELNMIKLVNALGIPEHGIAFAEEDKMHEVTGSVGGFTGPTCLHDCLMIVDSELLSMKNMCAGACREDYHLLNVNYGRDYEGHIVTDIKKITENDPCPVCGGKVAFARGIEVGQLFKLGTKYSEAMGAYYKDENQEDKLIEMGCYGIGVTRTLQAVAEQHHDDKGLIWPVSVAPYHVIIVRIDNTNEKQVEFSEKLYKELKSKKIEVMLDDRDGRPGVKFKDADLLGIPIRITTGKTVDEGKVEFKRRSEENISLVSLEEAILLATRIVEEEGGGV